METKSIIATCPDYESKNIFIRDMFWKRIEYSVSFSDYIKRNKGNILDIGCGRAKLFEKLNEKSPSLNKIGIDIEKDITKLKVKNARFVVVKKGAELPFPQGKFDEVFALDCLEHIPDLDFEVKEIKKVLRKKGTLIISGPTESVIYKIGRLLSKGTWEEVYESGEKHFRNIYDIRRSVCRHGFELERQKKIRFLFVPLFVVYKFRKK